jgi:sugar lactone lactonase YvrE
MTSETTADGLVGQGLMGGGTPAPDDAGAGTTGPGVPSPADATDEDRRRRRRLLLLLLGLLALLGILLTIALWYFLFRKPLPLPQIVDVPMPGYQTSIYGVQSPLGIAVTPDGSRIYVADTEGDRVVRVFALSGAELMTLEPPAETGTEHVPIWVALNPVTSDVYVSDRPTGQIYVYDQDGVYAQTFAPTTAIPGWQPAGIAFDATGNILITDLSGPAPRIELFDPSGNLLRTFGEQDHLWFPNGVAVDKRGNVYVADSNNGRLLVYAPDGTLVSQVGRGVGIGKLGLPRGLSIDDEGRVQVGDPTAQGVHVFRVLGEGATELQYLGFFGSQGIGDGQLSFPNGVASDTRGRVYITDTGNSRIQVWSY